VHVFATVFLYLGDFSLNRSSIFVPGFYRRRPNLAPVVSALLFLFCVTLKSQTSWIAAGPPGGDARVISSVPGQPSHLYLGTVASWIYESFDTGANWHRLAKLDRDGDLVLDHIVVDATDPKTIYVAAWRHADGGLWISHDSGKTWDEAPDLHGQSIRSFLQAPSDPKILFAGTLMGVFRSNDSGATWTQISEKGSRELHEVESLAVDPTDPDVVYAGTWHLPWKTTDGGKTWHNIKQGIIDDSDVFSIILDPEKPQTVFLSACSGIYKSETAGAKFRKIQGIPSTARRTRVLKQDPADRKIVYAGTTEGLYKTIDGGKTFSRMTSSDLIVNDVYIDPNDSNRVLLATDRGGVQVSTDAAKTFAASNEGFSQRKVAALLVDRDNPSHLYAGVVNDKSFGGVFTSNDQGKSWEQLAVGLEGRDVFTLSQTKDGTVIAGTGHGIFLLDPPANPDHAASPASSTLTWEPRNLIANTVMKVTTQTVRRTKVNVEKPVKAPQVQLDSRVNALDVSGDIWLAASALGLLTSRDQGASWQGGPVLGTGEYISVASHDQVMVAARVNGVVVSRDGGSSWWPIGLPTMITRIRSILFDPTGTLWLAAREGVFFSKDDGKTWLWIGRLPFRDVDDVGYDAGQHRVLVSSRGSDEVFSIEPKSMTWTFWHSGFRMELIRVAGDRLVAASLDDGVLLGPSAKVEAKQ
jgi:photosystem II stability/assembly factor-like uncharacterized protein